MKIASILPYKENYSKHGAGAVALWISEFMRDSIYKNKTYVIGNTLNKSFLTKNYININISNFNLSTSILSRPHAYIALALAHCLLFIFIVFLSLNLI